MSLSTSAQSLYDAPPRAYHNWAHVEACLAELDRVRHLCDRADLVEIAIWFHDAVYDATRSDNEAKSADAAEAAMAGLFADDDIAIVRQLILDTRHTVTPTTKDGKLIVDIDLAILGKSAHEFAAYETAIRQEYGHVGDADFAKGRTTVLRKFLDRPAIYATAYFHERYEAAARANLITAIQRWSAY